MRKVLILMLISCFLLTGCGKKEIKLNIESEENYEFRVKFNGTIGKKSFEKNWTIYKYNDEQIKVTEDGNDLYFVFDNQLYKDKYKKEKLKENYPTDFSYLYTIFKEKKKIIEKGDDLIGKKTYQFYTYEESKKNMNKLFKNLGLDVKVSEKPKVVLYLYNDNIYNVMYKVNSDNESYKIDIDFYDFKNVTEIKEKFYDDIVAEEDDKTIHKNNSTNNYDEGKLNNIYDIESGRRGKNRVKK